MPVTSGVIYSRGSVLGTTKVKSYNSLAALDTVYTIDAKLQGDTYISDEGHYHYTPINATGGQTIVLVSGTPDRQIEVRDYTVVSSGTTGVSFISSGTVVSTICGPLSMVANGSIINADKSMITAAGAALTINTTASTIRGSLSYRLV